MIDLDVLLDTRLGLLSSIDEQLAVDVLDKGWRIRQSNEISQFTDRLTDEQFKNKWENRTSDVLVWSRPTNFIFELAKMLEQLETNFILDSGRIKQAMVLINIYPYADLTEDEQIDILDAMRSLIKSNIEFKICNFSHSITDLPFLKQHEILTYVVYDWVNWFHKALDAEKGQKAFIPYPKLTIIAPAVLTKKDDVKKFTAEEKQMMGNKSPFELLRVYWSALFGLQFYPIELMSVLDMSILPDED